MRRNKEKTVLHEGQIRETLGELVKYGLDDRGIEGCRITSVPVMFSGAVGLCPSVDLSATDPAKVLQTIFASVYKAGFESGRCDAEYRQMQGLVQLIPGLERFVTDLAEQVADKVIDQRMNTSQYQ